MLKVLIELAMIQCSQLKDVSIWLAARSIAGIKLQMPADDLRQSHSETQYCISSLYTGRDYSDSYMAAYSVTSDSGS